MPVKVVNRAGLKSQMLPAAGEIPSVSARLPLADIVRYAALAALGKTEAGPTA